MSPRVLGELPTEEALLRAIDAVRSAGFDRLEVYSPIPLESVDAALRAPRSRLPTLILAGGVFGAAGGYALEWLLDAYLYPLDVGGRPPHFPLAYVPITFEMGVLAAALTAFVGVLVRARLLRPYDPVFEAPGFESASRDAYWLELRGPSVESDPDAALDALARAGAARVVRLGDGP